MFLGEQFEVAKIFQLYKNKNELDGVGIIDLGAQGQPKEHIVRKIVEFFSYKIVEKECELDEVEIIKYSLASTYRRMFQINGQ